MKVLVTGATGFIGFHVARLLVERGVQVRALVREGREGVFACLPEVEPVKGDVRDSDSVRRALEGCDGLYHLAADYRLWVPDPGVMYDINVKGTQNVMAAALRLGTEKVVYTSTVGVLAGKSNGRPADERTGVTFGEMTGHYKKSKFIAEKEVYGFIEKGVPAVIVNPSTPVGPMDRRPTPTGKMIVDFLNGRMPAYIDTGLNFVDVEDVAAGHLLAAEKGEAGKRYILGNRNMSLKEFFGMLARISGRKAPRIRMPYLPVLIGAYIDEAVSKLVSGRQPSIPLTGVKMARTCMYFDCSKAITELGLPQSPLEGALKRTVEWFEKNGYVVNHPGGRS